MCTRKQLLAAACAAVFAVLVAVSADAWVNSRQTNYLTFSGSVALPGVTLAPGTYIFERLDSLSTRDIVQVSSRDRSRVHYMGFTIEVERPAGQRSTPLVTLGEAVAGEAPPVRAWFPVGEPIGHRFVYPSR